MENVRARLLALESDRASIAQSLRELVRLEQHHADTRSSLDRAFNAIKAASERQEAQHAAVVARIQQVDDQVPDRLSDRLQAIEGRAPLWNLTSGWVLAFTVGAALMLLVAVGRTVITGPKADPAPTRQTAITEPLR